MSESLDHALRVLGVAADSDGPVVDHAYRRLARATHPDVNSAPDAAERFAALEAAYRLLREDSAGRVGQSSARESTARESTARESSGSTDAPRLRVRAARPPLAADAPVYLHTSPPAERSAGWTAPLIVAGPARVTSSRPDLERGDRRW